MTKNRNECAVVKRKDGNYVSGKHKKTNAQQSREQMEKACLAKFTLWKFPMSMFG